MIKFPRCLWVEGNGDVYLLAVYTAFVSTDGDELLTADREAISESLVGRSVGGDQGVNLLLGELYFDKPTLATVSTSVTPPRTRKKQQASLPRSRARQPQHRRSQRREYQPCRTDPSPSGCKKEACQHMYRIDTVGCFDFEGNNEGHIRGRGGTVM